MLLADDAGRRAADRVGAVIAHCARIRVCLSACGGACADGGGLRLRVLGQLSQGDQLRAQGLGLCAVVVVLLGAPLHEAIQCAHLRLDLFVQLCVDLLQAEEVG